MKSTYNKTRWVDGKTPVNANNMNKLESAIKELYDGALEVGMIQAGDGIKVSTTDGINLKISVGDEIMKSSSIQGIEVITELPGTLERNKLYLLLRDGSLDSIILNEVTIFNATN